jgi:hypothetical protein
MARPYQKAAVAIRDPKRALVSRAPIRIAYGSPACGTSTFATSSLPFGEALASSL